MKKIVYIAISSQTGGVPRYIVSALKYAKKKNVKITVIVPNDGEYFSKFKELTDDVVNLPLKPYSFSSLWKIRNYICKNKIQLVHSHGKGAGMYARPLKLLCPGIKVVHTFHGIYIEEYGRLLTLIYKGIENCLKYLTDAAICVSKSEWKEAVRLRFAPKRKTYIIPNGVDLNSFCSVNKGKEHYEKEFGLPSNLYILGCVARFEVMKGHKYLLRAYQQFLNKHPDSHLFLIGDGPDRDKIKEQIKELGLESHITLTGFRHDIPGLLQYFDVFLSASLKEGMPFTLLEALAAGTPVIATKVIGNQDIIENQSNGVLVKAKSTKDLYRGMCYVKEHPEKWETWIKNGKVSVKKNFTIQHSMKRLFLIYDQLLK